MTTIPLGRARGPRAFTLVEVLMAIMIFALSAIILASAYVNVLNSYMLVERVAQSSADLTFARSLVLTEPDRKKLEEGVSSILPMGATPNGKSKFLPPPRPTFFQ